MMEKLNTVELELKKVYDEWGIGKEYEENPAYKSMFRMGFPNEFVSNPKPLVMYVGQECLSCESFKTQSWIRKHQTDIRDKGHDHRPFWRFYLDIGNLGYDVLWNNLDKFHPAEKQRLSCEDAVKLSAPYGEDNRSILQREIEIIKPDVIVFAIGKGKYIDSLASALSIERSILAQMQPTVKEPWHCLNGIEGINDAIALNGTKVIWTYHPTYLNRCKKYAETMDAIRDLLKDHN